MTDLPPEDAEPTVPAEDEPTVPAEEPTEEPAPTPGPTRDDLTEEKA